MKALFILVLSLLLSTQAWAGGVPVFNKLVEAIGKAENSIKYPYGIKSIDTHGDRAYARRICYNTVKNNWVRYERSKTGHSRGLGGDFLTFLGQRYCPTSGKLTPLETALNRNWVSNVRFYYEQ